MVLEEYVDANGGFEDVERGNKWTGISSALGLGQGDAGAIRKMYLRHMRPHIPSDLEKGSNGRDEGSPSKRSSKKELPKKSSKCKKEKVTVHPRRRT